MADEDEALTSLGISSRELTEARWLSIACAELGVRETPGSGVTERVAEYLKVVGMPADDDIAWCSAFMNWVFRQVGVAGSGKPNARSWLAWGEATDAKPGAVAVLWREAPTSWKGHVALFVRRMGSHVLLLGGNQQDRVCLLSYPSSRVLAYRWPPALTPPER